MRSGSAPKDGVPDSNGTLGDETFARLPQAGQHRILVQQTRRRLLYITGSSQLAALCLRSKIHIQRVQRGFDDSSQVKLALVVMQHVLANWHQGNCLSRNLSRNHPQSREVSAKRTSSRAMRSGSTTSRLPSVANLSAQHQVSTLHSLACLDTQVAAQRMGHRRA